MIIDSDSPALQGDAVADELQNSKILLITVDKAIKALVSGGSASYTVDTGQTQWTATKNDIGKLNTMRQSLLNDIQKLESVIANRNGPSLVQVVPLW
jgi:hypothetical protein